MLGLHQDDAAAWTAQRLVRRRCHHVGERHWVRVATGGNQAGVMRHVDPENRADFLGDLGKALEIDAQRVGRGAGDDDLRLVFAGQRFHLVVVNRLFGIQAIGNDVEPLARHVQRHAVRKVATFRQAHAHDRVARLGKGHQHRLVGLRTGIRLDVRAVGAEQLFQSLDGDRLGNVNVFTAAVVTLARIAFGVLVGQLRPPAPPSRLC